MADYMTLPRLHFLTSYWSKYPPAHLSLSAIIGAFGKTKSKKAPRMWDRDSDKPDGNYVEGGQVAVDQKGNPLTQSPKSLASAVQMLGGKVFKVRPRGRQVN